MKVTVRDVMTAKVVAVRQNASYKEMATRLRKQGVSAFPVLDEQDIVIGVVSEADMLAKEALSSEIPNLFSGMLHHREQAKAAGVTAADLMTKPAITISADDTVAQAARLMYDRRVKRLPVVTAEGKLIGIVSRTDVLSVYGRPDSAIKDEITGSMLPNAFLVDPALFTITVKDGIVTIEGKPETSTVGHDIIAAVRHITGVVSVRDRLTYPPEERRAPGPGPLF